MLRKLFDRNRNKFFIVVKTLRKFIEDLDNDTW